MATAGYGMKFGKGYLGGGGEKPQSHEMEPQGEQGGGDEAIKQHLAERHAETGHAHSHIEHHGDGRHTSHHISDGGEHSGPHEHASAEELVNHLKEHLPEEEQEIAEGGEEEDGE